MQQSHWSNGRVMTKKKLMRISVITHNTTTSLEVLPDTAKGTPYTCFLSNIDRGT
jgi:hypothetical protein